MPLIMWRWRSVYFRQRQGAVLVSLCNIYQTCYHFNELQRTRNDSRLRAMRRLITLECQWSHVPPHSPTPQTKLGPSKLECQWSHVPPHSPTPQTKLGPSKSFLADMPFPPKP
ncbi:hypothetical protein SDJN03_02814, partial [Cucurbita argyrosperma subsp. sororia]